MASAFVKNRKADPDAYPIAGKIIVIIPVLNRMRVVRGLENAATLSYRHFKSDGAGN